MPVVCVAWCPTMLRPRPERLLLDFSLHFLISALNLVVCVACRRALSPPFRKSFLSFLEALLHFGPCVGGLCRIPLITMPVRLGESFPELSHRFPYCHLCACGLCCLPSGAVAAMSEKAFRRLFLGFLLSTLFRWLVSPAIGRQSGRVGTGFPTLHLITFGFIWFQLVALGRGLNWIHMDSCVVPLASLASFWLRLSFT